MRREPSCSDGIALDVAGVLLAEMHLILDSVRLSLKRALVGKKDGQTVLDEALRASDQLCAFAHATIEHLSQLNRLQLLPQQERLLDDLLVQYKRILVEASPAFRSELRCEFEEGRIRGGADPMALLHARDETENTLRLLWAAFRFNLTPSPLLGAR
jgi:hypothetical protein